MAASLLYYVKWLRWHTLLFVFGKAVLPKWSPTAKFASCMKWYYLVRFKLFKFSYEVVLFLKWKNAVILRISVHIVMLNINRISDCSIWFNLWHSSSSCYDFQHPNSKFLFFPDLTDDNERIVCNRENAFFPFTTHSLLYSFPRLL